MPGIVVGMDGSRHSVRALEWAMREAGLRHADLAIVAVNPVPKSQWTGNPVTGDRDARRTEEARRGAEAAAAKVAGQLAGEHPASVTVHAISGYPAEELIGASDGADLVVVGSRGGGGFARLLLGSVGSQVVRHARCPVVVVPTGT